MNLQILASGVALMLAVLMIQPLGADSVQNFSQLDPELQTAVNLACNAIVDDDLETEYGFLYDPIVQKLSKGQGPASLIILSRKDAKLTSTTFFKPKGPFTIVQTEKHDFVIIPTRSKFSLIQPSDHTISHWDHTGYMIAIRQRGTKKWSFIYDYNLGIDKVEQAKSRAEFFPDLPLSITLPPQSSQPL